MNQTITHIWNKFHNQLRQVIMRKVKNPADAEDILQDVFVSIQLNFQKVTGAENTLQYISAMVRNAVADYFRKNKDSHSLDLQEIELPTDSIEDDLNTTIAHSWIKPFINQLPEKYKEALIQTEFKKVPQNQLAAQLNISYSAAKSRVQRGREKLRKLIVECCTIESDKYGNIQEVAKRNCRCD